MLGFNLGPVESMGEPSSENPKGFWEQLPVRNLNDFLLQSLGAAWDNPHDFAIDRLDDRSRFDFFRLAERLISRFRGDVPWAIKDPRLSLTLDAWRPLLDDPVVLLVFRNPVEVASSLKARNGFPLEYGLALWEKYVIDALKNSAGMPLLTVDYGDIVATPVEAVDRLQAKLSEYFPERLVKVPEEDLLEFIDPALHHERSRRDGTADGIVLNESQEALYAVLEANGDWSHEVKLEMSPGSQRLLRAAADLRSSERVLASARSSQASDQVESTTSADGLGYWGESSLDAVGRFADFLPQAEHFLDSLGDSVERIDSFDARLTCVEERLQGQKALLDRQDRTIERLQQTLATRDAGKKADQVVIAHSVRRASESAGELQQLLAATRQSWRWKVGNALVRMVEAVLLRGKPMLALDAMDSGLARLRHVLHELSEPVEGESAADAGHLLGADEVRVLDEMPLPGRLDVVIFPIIDWHFRIQRPQHIAREMARRGNRVFYLTIAPLGGAEAPGFRLVEMPEHGVFICELQVPSAESFDLYGGKISAKSVDEIRAALKALWKSRRIAESVSIVQHPSWHRVVQNIPSNFVVYDCMDHHAGFSTHTREVGRHERGLLSSSDLVVVTSEWLSNLHSEFAPSLIRNAAEIERFLPLSQIQESRTDKGPVVGYIGTIAEWFDLDLIIQSAKKFKEWQFVLVGSTAGCDTSEAERLSNIVFKGERPYAEVGEYLRRFDVCVIPFKLTDLIKATNPVKVYEYLAAGKPVVSVELPELEVMREFIYLAKNKDDWNEKLAMAMRQRNDRDLIVRRTEWAQEHSWASRSEELETAIRDRLPSVSVIILAYNNLEFSRACIESVLKHTQYPDFEIIIVDNGSSDGSIEYFREMGNRHSVITVVRNEENLGFAGGNNIGIDVATGEIVILLNNDTYVTPGWLHGLVRQMTGPAALDLAGPVTNNIGNEAKVEIVYDSMEVMIDAAADYTWQHAGEIMAVNNLAFFCVAIARRVIESVGVLDESFQGGFFEDDDYCRRATDAGFKLGIVEDAFVHHHLSASFDQLGKERKQEIFDANKAVYERKWGAWIPHSSRVLKQRP